MTRHRPVSQTSRKFFGGEPGVKSLKSGFLDRNQADGTAASDGDRTSTNATVAVEVDDAANPASVRTLSITPSFPGNPVEESVATTPVTFRVPISRPTITSNKLTNKKGCWRISTAKVCAVACASFRYVSSSRRDDRRSRFRAITPLTDGVAESVPPFNRSKGPGTPAMGVEDVV
jgi:hypothetical protein